MFHIFLRIQLFFFPFQIFGGFWDWFSESVKKDPKVDFKCVYQCGEWGSSSIQSLEWEFVQCLYSATELEDYIAHNYWLRANKFWSIKNSQSFVPEEARYYYVRPQDFNSPWYQEALNTNKYWFIYLSEGIPDRWGCRGSQTGMWRILHVNDEKGNHIGKYFERLLATEYYDPRAIEFPEEDGHANEDIERHSFQPRQQNIYNFGNFIDFSHACLALENDLFLIKNANPCRSYKYSPLFAAQVETRCQQICRSVCSLRDNHHAIFASCAQEHGSPSAYYNLALYELARGEYEKSLDYFRSLLDIVKLDSLEQNLASTIYQTAGGLEADVALYDTAILKLTKAIELNPGNKEAYFERAFAYFEKGEFERAIQDFSENGSKVFFSSYREDPYLGEYTKGILKGVVRGLGEATTEFLPSLCHSIRGAGNLLWVTAAHPVDASSHFVAAVLELIQFFSVCDASEVVGLLVPEMRQLSTEWDKLRERQRGELIGYILGKYGTEIFLPAAAIKGVRYVKAYHQMRRAEKLCTLKALTHSPESRIVLEEAATKWNAQRVAWFERVELEIEKQNRHVPGKQNYQEGKSIWILPEERTRELLKKHAGKGQKSAGVPGEAGYKERVDFQEIVGYYVDMNTKEKSVTTMGNIHYSKEGAHIVPAKPK